MAEEYKVMANKTLLLDHWPAIGCDECYSLINYWPSEAVSEVFYFSHVLTDIEVAQRCNQGNKMRSSWALAEAKVNPLWLTPACVGVMKKLPSDQVIRECGLLRAERGKKDARILGWMDVGLTLACFLEWISGICQQSVGPPKAVATLGPKVVYLGV